METRVSSTITPAASHCWARLFAICQLRESSEQLMRPSASGSVPSTLWNEERERLRERLAGQIPIEDGELTVNRTALDAPPRLVIPSTQAQPSGFRLLSANDALFLRIFRDRGLRSDDDRARLARIITVVTREATNAKRRLRVSMTAGECWNFPRYLRGSLAITVQIVRIRVTSELHFAGYGEWRGCILQGLVNLDQRAA